MPQIAGFRGVVPNPSKLTDALAPDAAGTGYATRLAGGALARDPGRAVYRYHLTFSDGGRAVTRKMLVCAVRLVPWTEGTVRPHAVADEAVRTAELARIRATRAHGGAVLAGYRDAPGEIERQFRKAEASRPTLETTTADGATHRIWRVADAEIIGKLRPALAPKKLHVLDGHARYEAMLAYHEELAQKGSLALYSSANYGLACLVELSDPTIVVAARHRLLRVPSPPKAEAALADMKKLFLVDRIANGAKDAAVALAALAADQVAHQPAFVVAFAGDTDAYKLTLKPDVSPSAEGVTVDRSVAKLEPFVVEHLFRERALKDATGTSTTDAKAALAALGKGSDVAILARPVSLAEVLRVDELGQRLPAHATAFHPQLLDGLVHLPIDADEDLV